MSNVSDMVVVMVTNMKMATIVVTVIGTVIVPVILGWPLGYLTIFLHGFHKDPEFPFF